MEAILGFFQEYWYIILLILFIKKIIENPVFYFILFGCIGLFAILHFNADKIVEYVSNSL
jgi:hypothetical protein